MTYRMLAIPVLALFAFSGCTTTGGGNLSSRVDRHDQQIQMLLSQVGQVEQVLPGQAEMWSQMQTMRQELNMLHGRMDELQGGGDSTQLRDRLNRLEAVVRQMAAQQGVNTDSLNVTSVTPYYPAGQSSSSAPGQSSYAPPAAAGAGAPAPAAASGAQGGSSDTATALYDAGIKAFDDRRYKEAVVSFKDFVATYPKHRLTSNAHFWQGESYFQLKDYARAALAYQEVIANFAGSSKLQSAMLKQGISLHHANKKPAGRERLQELVKRYPNSPEASRAKQFLAQNK